MRSPAASILPIATGEPAKKMNSPSFTGGAPVMVERATTTGSVPSVITGLKKSEKLATGECVFVATPRGPGGGLPKVLPALPAPAGSSPTPNTVWLQPARSLQSVQPATLALSCGLASVAFA